MTGPQQPRAAVDPGQFGGRLRTCRLRACRTLQQVADVVGCTRGYLSALERSADGGNVSAELLYAIARHLGTSVEYLLRGEEPCPARPVPPRARIRTFYCAEVEIPESIATEHQFTTAYARFRESFARLHGEIHATCDERGLRESFVATERADAEVFVARWLEQIARWQDPSTG